jgi:glycosyltransferase involved in cell wall biosynthesis
MKQVCIGIHVHAEPERLQATLESLRAHTTPTIELLLLPDGPDEATQAVLATLDNLWQSGTEEPLGPPACFNRLVTSSDAAIFVLLESGALVGPAWLDYLLAALDVDPRYGLAGPSTNHAWNDQRIFPRRGGTPTEVARTAQEAAQRFGLTTRVLEPLHSLADFCYVVRREVVQAVGAADEGYGLGPCWEMDYNIRAARAGFRGVWACAAYVHRAPFTARRRREEARRFEASKRRYQDKFCALRLRGECTSYEPHCRGEACEHFAPPELIQIQMPLPISVQLDMNATDLTRLTPTQTGGTPPPAPAVPPPSLFAAGEASQGPPLVSCIMPTRGRVVFVLQSIRYFQRQDYPARELIIVDDGTDDLASQLPDDAHIRYLRLPPGQSIGAKRNRACTLARGSLIAHWDDDDWYAPSRLSAQAAPLLAGAADISGLTGTVFFDLTRWEFWGCTPELHRRLFVEDVHGGTLVYRRHVWEHLAHYPNQSLAEDAALLRQAVRRGARLCHLPNDNLFLYLRHTGNAWSFACGQYLDPQGWRRMAEPMLPLADRAFYAARSSTVRSVPASSPVSHPAFTQPLASCIMPTANRRAFVPQAIAYFLRQDYPNCELIVVDDGTDAVAEVIPPDPRIRYIRLARQQTIGAKRNLACQEARGEIIVHWDDDDWMAPWRLSYQMACLFEHHVDICGLDTILYYDLKREQAWQYIYPQDSKPWVAGNTLCYTKAFWRRNPFPDINVGEDTCFMWSNQPKTVLALQDITFYVALMHCGNTSPKRLTDQRWHSYSVTQIRNLMGKDWDFYTALLVR